MYWFLKFENQNIFLLFKKIKNNELKFDMKSPIIISKYKNSEYTVMYQDAYMIFECQFLKIKL